MISVRDVQLLNVSSLIILTEFPRSIFFKDIHNSKAETPISSTLSGTLISVKCFYKLVKTYQNIFKNNYFYSIITMW